MLPTDDATRKRIKVFQGFFQYFPDAVAAIAELSCLCNEQHNPGESVHWAKEKSTEELDSQARHLLGIASEGPLARDVDGILEATKNAWRACANLQRLADAGHNIFAERVSLTEPCILDDPHTPTPAEIRDIERGGDPIGGPFEVRFTNENTDGTPLGIETRGPYDTYEQAESYAARNPEKLQGRTSIHTSKLKVRDHA